MPDALHGAAVLAFLALAVAAAWLTPARWQGAALLAVGAAMVGWFSPLSLALLAVATLASYGAARLQQGRALAIRATMLLTAGGYLVFLWLSQASWSRTNLLAAAVPFGMAYYVLRIVHYLAETEREGFRQHGLQDYAQYQFLPAALFVGPIHRFDEYLRDLRRRRWDGASFSVGAGRVLMGLFQIVVLDSALIGQKIVPLIERADLQGAAHLYVDAALFWSRLYILFSGYTEVAVGAALMMGFQLRENFNRPYLARNIGDFWRRWHMSLSSWCRDYVYMPVLAGVRNHTAAAAASMVVLGLWHAVSLHYLLWGLYHGIGLAIWRAFSIRTAPVYARLPPAGQAAWTTAARVATLHFVMFSFAATNAVERLLPGS